MTNPYEPATATNESPTGSRDWDRNQCPYCLQRQSVWSAINTIWTYRCTHCHELLAVTLSRRLSRFINGIILSVLTAFLICYFVYDLRPPSHFFGLGIVLIASGFLLRYCFGYFHPVGHRWIDTRRDLDSESTSDRQAGG